MIFQWRVHPVCSTAFISGALLWVFALTSCREVAVEYEVEDVEYNSYLAYKNIFNGYRVVPADSTKLALEQYLKKYPTDSRAHTFYGRILYEMNNIDSSVAAYRAALQHDSLFKEAHAGLGAVYTLLHKNDSALHYLMNAIALGDTSPYTFLNLSILSINRGEPKRSLAFADSAYLRMDSLPSVAAGLSLVYDRQKQPKRSRAMFEQAIALGLADTGMFKEVLLGNVKIEDYYRANRY